MSKLLTAQALLYPQQYASAMSSPYVVIVGPPGAGKSTVGRALAARLDLGFVDVDAVIEERVGKSIRDIFVDEGEAAFRVMEERAVAEAIREADGVVSLGGGAVLNTATRQILADQQVIYLQVEFPDAVRRIGLTADRPVLALNPRATLRQLLADRHPLYVSVATETVQTSGRSVEDVVEEVATLLHAKESAQ